MISTYSITCRNNASIFQFQTSGLYSDGKMNIFGALYLSKVNFQKRREKPKKIKEKREFLRKASFRPNRFFYMVVIQKQITINT
ncbi:Uncharacterized protein FWK35_00014672 [Aphis craccivora]|uniref:Uncharacterized protein n=1 Tax=Aphis craccivora TaxID=307492 RepID=A0A6G0Y339_APHCR|nr:Uncharacterized protein FWK35_00014672 [Aphis craccivora]